MLRMHTSKNSAQAKDYFTDSLNRGDYYSEGQEMAGRWGGKLAAFLGLEGEVRQSDFFALCENRLPGTNEKLTPRTKDGRRVGVDINFHVPKSVSLLYALGDDSRILEAFRQSVTETMRELEAEMRTRIRKDGQDGDRVTGEMVWAEFLHTTARPVNGVPDPHLHAHCFTFNVTRDSVEDRLKAGEFEQLKKKAPYFEARFHNRMSRRMVELGYKIGIKAKFWEVEGIPDSLIRLFSQRTAQITALATELGIENDPKLKAELGAKSREPKNKTDSFEELKKEWKQRAGERGMGSIYYAQRHQKKSEWKERDGEREERESEKTGEPEVHDRAENRKGKLLLDGAKKKAAHDAVSHAIAHMFERMSTVTERSLAHHALRSSYGQTSPEYIDAVLEKQPFLRRTFRGDEWVTTREVFKEEQRMVTFAKESRGRCSRFVDDVYELADKTLNNGQRSAVRHILNSYDQVMLIQGGAGTGKTKLMTETISAIEHSGHRVLVLAPLSDTARQTLPEQGFKDAETVASLLVNEKLQEKYKGGVLWIDEAGLIGTRTMNEIFDVAKERKCRVVLVRGTGQHNPIERGDAIDNLIEEAGMQSAEVTAVVRQKGEYKEACERLNAGDIKGGWEGLEKLGFIKEINSQYTEMTEADETLAREINISVAHQELADEYVEAVKAGKSVLATAPTHKEGEALTGVIRQKLRSAGYVKTDSRDFVRLNSLGWTDAEKADVNNYRPGMVIQFHQQSWGMKASERAEVMGTLAGQVLIKGIGGGWTPVVINHNDGRKFSVFEQDTVKIATGDYIRFTANGKTVGDLIGFLPDRRNPLRSRRQLAEELGESLGLAKKKIRHDPRRLNNGAMDRVIGFVPLSGDIILKSGKVVSKHYGHLTHGYCLTPRAAQSKGVHVALHAQTSMSFGMATNMEQFTVAATRGMEMCRFYTDNKVELRQQIEKSSGRISASKVAREGTRSTAANAKRYRDFMKDRDAHREKEGGREYER